MRTKGTHSLLSKHSGGQHPVQSFQATVLQAWYISQDCLSDLHTCQLRPLSKPCQKAPDNNTVLSNYEFSNYHLVLHLSVHLSPVFQEVSRKFAYFTRPSSRLDCSAELQTTDKLMSWRRWWVLLAVPFVVAPFFSPDAPSTAPAGGVLFSPTFATPRGLPLLWWSLSVELFGFACKFWMDPAIAYWDTLFCFVFLRF